MIMKLLYKCRYCNKELMRPCALAIHERTCRLNPNRKPFENHICNWPGRKPMNNWKCKFCGEIFETRQLMAAHDKICSKRDYPVPNQKYIIDENGKRHLAPGCTTWNKGLTKETNKILEKASQTFIQHIKDGTYKPIGHPHTEERKQKMRELAIKRHLGGWHTSKTIEYKGIKLDSTYELNVAKNLDENQIKWERPKYLLWKDQNGLEHRYYPDFYLPEYNVYLDPKNDYLINNESKRYGITDTEKIKIVEQQNNVKIIILDKNNLTWESIKKLL